MQRSRVRNLLLAAGITLALAAPATSAAAADNASHCGGQSPHSTSVAERVTSATTRPVVLVHGWSGSSKDMTEVESRLGDQLNKGLKQSVVFLQFDYRADNYHWAAVPAIASCLADYLQAVSAAHRQLGGDGKVIVVAHSMGGLAVRFATDARFAEHPVGADILAGVVTLDTPALGSPFGNGTLARALEPVKSHHPVAGLPAPAGSDGSVCLAEHDRHQGLPNGCAIAPYLPAGVPVAQIAGDVVIHRSIFGLPLYDIDLGSDGIVGSGSSQGYVESGPPDTPGQPSVRPPSGSRIVSRPQRCTIGFDAIPGLAVKNGFISGGRGALAQLATTLGPGLSFDTTTLNQLLDGRQGTALMPFLLTATVGAPCSHINITSYGPALSDAAAVIQAYLEQIKSGGSSLPTSSTAFAPYVGTWYAHGAILTVNANFTATVNWNAGTCDGSGPKSCYRTARLQFTPIPGNIVGKVTSVERNDTSWFKPGQIVHLRPGPEFDTIDLLVDGIENTTSPTFCGPRNNNQTGICGQ